jgi:hypothetical protein
MRIGILMTEFKFALGIPVTRWNDYLNVAVVAG